MKSKIRIRKRMMTKIYRKSRKNNINKIKILFTMFAIILIVIIGINNKNNDNLDIPIENVMAFKITYENMMKLKELSIKYNIDFSELVTYYSLENNYFDDKIEIDSKIEQDFIMNYSNIKKKYTTKNVEEYYKLFDNIYKEIKCFPISVKEGEEIKYIYGDSWGSQRTYGGNRIHMGTDIMDRENIRGRIPIISMTDGIIENIGWNEKGGWRIGIRTNSGMYYYYAHLDKYKESLSKGTAISSGDLLGYMGDTGYSKIEGTKGNFEVHLHVGISLYSKLYKEELWINPYPFLRLIEGNV